MDKITLHTVTRQPAAVNPAPTENEKVAARIFHLVAELDATMASADETRENSRKMRESAEVTIASAAATIARTEAFIAERMRRYQERRMGAIEDISTEKAFLNNNKDRVRSS